MNPMAEYRDVDAEAFAGIASRYEPAVLRGIASGWPAVKKARESDRAIRDYLASFDSGAAVDVLRMPPSARGRIFYNDDLTGFNFTRDKQSISAALERIHGQAARESPQGIAAQSAPVAECLPRFTEENYLAILDASIAPRIWIGNRVVTPAHFDESNNVACVVAGRRRFTLLPPDQIANLYIGPLDFAPTGTPISMVSFREPDLERYPRFREAMAAMRVADLEPGDAIYIPTLWWHHVESLAGLNILVNYWWKGAAQAAARAQSALDCLYHCLLNLKHVAPEHRAAWGAIFEHYVFNGEYDPGGHLPQSRRGILGDVSPDRARQIRAFLVKQLQRE